MNEIFKWNNINGFITDYTMNAWGTKFKSIAQLEDCRAYENIKNMLKNNEIENWLAIDDIDLNPWISEEHFIRTPRANEGIKQSGIKIKLLSILLN